MRILIGPQPGEDYEELDPVQVGRLLQVLRLRTEYLVLDLPSQPTAATQAAVDLCDFVGVVTEREAGAIRAAIEHRDDRRLKQAAHKLKGSAGVFKDVPAAQKAAQQMECVGADADWDQVENAWSNLAAEMDRLMTTLQKASSSPIPVEE